MKYLSLEEILFIHYRILNELQPMNENFSITNIAGLQSAVERPQQTVFGKEAHEGHYAKAAALTEALISNHPFDDGNKRVGVMAGIVFMTTNGYISTATNDDVYELGMNAAKGEWRFEQIEEWFRRNFF